MRWYVGVAFPVIITLATCGQLVAQSSDDREVWLKAPALRPGDTIAIVAPSGPVNVDQVNAYAHQLRQAGFRVLVSESIARAEGYLAGTDDQRAEELNSMIRNPTVRAIFPARGGFGLTRILDRLDYQSLRRDPKIITGFSDITALHLAIAKNCRLITFHSPVPMADLWQADSPEFAYANSLFRRSVFAFEYAESQSGYSISVPEDRPAATLVGGTAQGRITGGNPTLISATMGTPFALDARQSILFLEDVDEAPYRIDRMLSQLRLSGVFQQVQGVILGDFSHNRGTTQNEIERVLRDYFADFQVPVVWRFPVGHIPCNATLPMGAMVELDGDRCSLRVMENPVTLR